MTYSSELLSSSLLSSSTWRLRRFLLLFFLFKAKLLKGFLLLLHLRKTLLKFVISTFKRARVSMVTFLIARVVLSLTGPVTIPFTTLLCVMRILDGGQVFGTQRTVLLLMRSATRTLSLVLISWNTVSVGHFGGAISLGAVVLRWEYRMLAELIYRFRGVNDLGFNQPEVLVERLERHGEMDAFTGLVRNCEIHGQCIDHMNAHLHFRERYVHFWPKHGAVLHVLHARG